MSFDLEGITFSEPEDLAVVSYDNTLYMSVANRTTNQVFLILLSDLESIFAMANHNEHGEYLQNGTCTCKVRFIESVNQIKVGTDSLNLSITDHPSAPQCHLNHGLWLYINGQDTNAKVIFNKSSVQTSPPNTSRFFTADGFLLHPCLALNKQNKTPIQNPKNKLSLLNGITFTQNGIPGTGIVFEELEATGLPGAVERDKEGVPYGINLLAVIPLLVEGLKVVMAELEEMKGGGSK